MVGRFGRVYGMSLPDVLALPLERFLAFFEQINNLEKMELRGHLSVALAAGSRGYEDDGFHKFVDGLEIDYGKIEKTPEQLEFERKVDEVNRAFNALMLE